MAKHFLNDDQINDIRNRKITWKNATGYEGAVAYCGHITGIYSWSENRISWSVNGDHQGTITGEHTDKSEKAVSKLEAIVKAKIEDGLKAEAARIERDIIDA